MLLDCLILHMPWGRLTCFCDVGANVILQLAELSLQSQARMV